MLNAENLAITHSAKAVCSAQAIDDSVKDVDFIIHRPTPGENGPYPFCSTYTGDWSTEKMDWWAITFPHPVRFNCVTFTHGRISQDGGYWIELDVQVQRGPGDDWVSVSGFRIFPDYDLSDRRGNRKPYESFAIRFDEVTATAVRLYGRPGGDTRYTMLSHMGVYRLDPDDWPPLAIAPTPIPRLYQLLEPERLAAIFFDFEKVTGMMISAETPIPPGAGLHSYLDEPLYRRFQALDPRQTTDENEFERLLYETEGGDRFMIPLNAAMREAARTREPVLKVHHGGLGKFAIPVIVQDQVIGLLINCTHFFCDAPDKAWHYRHARDLGISMDRYFQSLARLPVFPRERLEAMLHLLTIVANTIAELADVSQRREQQLKEMQNTIDQLKIRRNHVIEQAVSYMCDRLDQPFSLKELAKVVAVSPRHLSRLFKQETDQTPLEFLTDLRLDKAKTLLQEPGVRVTDVCYEAGYSSLSHFVRLFKRRFGVTPGRFARSVRNHAPTLSPPSER